jgi:nicotinamide-nucleotide amidase
MAEAESIATIADALVGEMIERGVTVSTAESCTGGWIAKALTDIAGSSAAFGYGIVSYSNDAKISLLGVDEDTLARHGAVSQAVVEEMASGVLNLSDADMAVAVSGIAGPDGGTGEKPVGTVWCAWAQSTSNGEAIDTERRVFAGGRESVRAQTVIWALQGLRERLHRRD